MSSKSLGRRRLLPFGVLIAAIILAAGCMGGGTGSDAGRGAALNDGEAMNLTAEDILTRLNSSDVERIHATYIFRMNMDGESADVPGSMNWSVEVWYESSKRYRVEAPGPEGRVAVSDGEKLWRYRPGEGEATVTEAGPGGLGYGNIPALAEVRLGYRTERTRPGENETDWSTRANATVLRTEEYDGKPCIVVRVDEVSAPGVTTYSPTETEQLFWIDREHWFPLKIWTKNSGDGGNVTVTMEYRNVTYNPEVPDGTFKFEAPEGVAVRTPTPPRPPGTREAVEFGSVEGAEAAGYDLPIPEAPKGTEVRRVRVSLSGDEVETAEVDYRADGILTFHLTTLQHGPSVYEGTENVEIDGAQGQFVEGKTIEGERGTGHMASKLYWRCGRFNASIAATGLSKREMVEMAESAGCE